MSYPISILYWCRSCNEMKPHYITMFRTDLPAENQALLECKCHKEKPFMVAYPKEALAPTATSRRVNEIVGSEEVFTTGVAYGC